MASEKVIMHEGKMVSKMERDMERRGDGDN
jgi:hypothetical protein